MRNSTRAAVLVGLLALASVFVRPVSAAGPATKIMIDPAAPTITADATQTFKVLAVADDGTSTDVTLQSTVSVNDPKGSVTAATYTPGKAGSWTVQASYQSFTTTAAVTVTPGAVKEIVINPDSNPETVYIGANQKFSATVYDAQDNVISGQSVAWSVLGENGTIDTAGTFVPKKVGTGKIQATIGDITGLISVVVSPAVVTNTNTAPIVTNTNTVKTNTNSTNVNTKTTNTNAAITQSTTATTKSCTSLKPWAWILMLVLFMIVVALLYALVPVTQIWPAVVSLVVAAVLAYIQRKYSCGGQQWWAWVVTLGTVVLTAVALQMRPKTTPTVS